MSIQRSSFGPYIQMFWKFSQINTMYLYIKYIRSFTATIIHNNLYLPRNKVPTPGEYLNLDSTVEMAVCFIE